MKSISSLVAVLIVSTSVLSQGSNDNITKLISGVYVGAPNADNVGLEANYALYYVDGSPTTNVVSSNSTPHFGIYSEYLVAPRVGVGLDIRYIQSYLEGDYISGNDNQRYRMRYDKTRIGFMPSLFLHFLDHDRVDLLLHFGAGYKTKTVKETSNEPNFQPRLIEDNLPPVAFRLGLDFRAYVTPNLGLTFGLGGGQGGIVKFGTCYRIP